MPTQDHVLSNDLLAKFAERCPVYDRENRFFTEDFADLKAAGYLTMTVPTELGGRGLTLAQSCRDSAGWPITRRPRLLASTCISIGSVSSPICGGKATSRLNGF